MLNDKFMWGAASAAYQIEGAYQEDGKGLGIWDAYTQEPGFVKNNENGNVACDHYHRYKEDITLFQQLGVKYYRFSISWPRVLPDGIGYINERGIQFYSDLIDELLAVGITPLITLFHWDYPHSLHLKGGWLNDDSPDWFEEYTKLIVERFSDRVSYWMTINEPQVFVGMGYGTGVFAPFYTLNHKDLCHITHNVLLSHGRAVKTIRNFAKSKPMIGYAPTGPCAIPSNSSTLEIERARKESFSFTRDNFIMSNSWWSDPIILGSYPDLAFELLGNDMPNIKKGDMELISQPLDFYGCNLYSSQGVYYSGDLPEGSYIGCPRTSMEWPLTPKMMYWSPKFLYERYHLPILITENGMANLDWIHIDGKVHDPQRIDFLTRYLRELKQASRDGIDVMGYIYWSIMDNFEWAYGYDKRFGLIYVDYLTQKRTLKDSAAWYRNIIETNGESL